MWSPMVSGWCFIFGWSFQEPHPPTKMRMQGLSGPHNSPIPSIPNLYQMSITYLTHAEKMKKKQPLFLDSPGLTVAKRPHICSATATTPGTTCRWQSTGSAGARAGDWKITLSTSSYLLNHPRSSKIQGV